MPDISFSNQYRHTISELHKARMENQITEQELAQRLDEARNEEAKRLELYAPLLLREALQNVEKDVVEEQTKVFDEKRQQERYAANEKKQQEINEQLELKRKEREAQLARERQEKQKQRELEQEQVVKEQERHKFRQVTGNDIDERNASARKLQQQYNILQIVLLVFSAVTATMAGIDGIARIWVAITGVIATIAGGVLTTFKIQDRIYANHKAAAELRLECQRYDYHIDEYKLTNEEDAFIKFSRAVNLIQGEQMLQEVELWNPKREESKKAQPDTKGELQGANDSKNEQTAEAPENSNPGSVVVDPGKNMEKGQDNVSSPPVQPSSSGEQNAQ